MIQKISELYATVFYIGKIPFAPGTIASLVSFLFIPLLLKDGFIPLITVLVITVLGYFAVENYIADLPADSDFDLPEIVIDEVIGQLIVLLMVTRIPIIRESLLKKSFMNKEVIIALVLSFVLFRLLDITKPLYIGYVDSNMNNAVGIILDDILAAITAFPIIAIVLTTLLGVLMQFI